MKSPAQFRHLQSAALAAALACAMSLPAAAQVPVDLTPVPPGQPVVVSPPAVRLAPATGEPYVDADVFYEAPGAEYYPGAEGDWSNVYVPSMPGEEVDQAWSWQVLPDGVIYSSYLAGVKEPRLSATFFNEKTRGTLLDGAIGGRVGIFRYGTENTPLPEGWEFDAEAAAFPRIDIDREWDLVSTDYRVGFPLTYGRGSWRAKLSYFHFSSHLGDEEAIALGGLGTRINYAKDGVLFGLSYYITPSARLYSEAGYAFYKAGGAEHWDFQFGFDYSPIAPPGGVGSPFFAVNGHIREELDYSGSVVGQLGWQWRGRSGHLLRIGAHYLNGASPQYQFFRTTEQQLGAAVWYDY